MSPQQHMCFVILLWRQLITFSCNAHLILGFETILSIPSTSQDTQSQCPRPSHLGWLNWSLTTRIFEPPHSDTILENLDGKE